MKNWVGISKWMHRWGETHEIPGCPNHPNRSDWATSFRERSAARKKSEQLNNVWGKNLLLPEAMLERTAGGEKFVSQPAVLPFWHRIHASAMSKYGSHPVDS